MGSMDTDSLFSLELVVDSLKLRKIVCRFPAVAFRLLDFPTLLIYHVEAEIADKIKTRLAFDSHYQIPDQLTDLQDKNGNFPFKKGKSCLFKVSANTLLSYLSMTPLYIMIVDTYPETSKLLGSCSIPLTNLMKSIHNDVAKMGLSAPSSHGNEGEFMIYNLMGEEIGYIRVGYRLSSFGVALLSHIPQNALVKPNAKFHSAKANVNATINQREDKDIQVTDIVPSKDVFAMFTQTDDHLAEFLKENIIDTQKEVKKDNTASTQTARKNKKLRNIERVAKNEERPKGVHFDDIFISDVFCPPPMFYNSDFEPQGVPKMIQQVQAKASMMTRENTNDEDSSSDDDTIREEDKFSDSDVDVMDDDRKRKNTRDRRERSKEKMHSEQRVKIPALPLKSDLIVAQNYHNYPLLNALLSEILSLKGFQPQLSSAKSPPRPSVSTSTIAKTEGGSSTARSGSPRPFAGGAGLKHQLCVPQGGAVPKNKSWLRQQPERNVLKKTKLTFGMTNTQRLRLGKVDQGYVRELERHDRERREKMRGELRKKYPWLKGGGGEASFVSNGPMEISTEIGKHTAEREGRVVPKKRQSIIAEIKKQHQKKPVPTPRKSILPDDEELLRQIESISSKHKIALEENDIEQKSTPEVSSGESGQRHVRKQKRPGIMDNIEERSSRENSDRSVAPLGRTYDVKIATPQKEKEKVEDKSKDDKQSSVPQGAAEEPQLKRYIEKYSSSSESEPENIPPKPNGKAAAPGEVPRLKLYVEAYSSYSDEEKPMKTKEKGNLRHGENSDNSSFRSNSSSDSQKEVAKALAKSPKSNGSGAKGILPTPSVDSKPAQAKESTRPALIDATGSNSYDSTTAYVVNPGSSVDSAEGGERFSHSGANSPTRVRSMQPAHADSVSSYAPSDGAFGADDGKLSPVSTVSLGAENYSEGFENESSDNAYDFSPLVKDMKEMKLDPNAKFGYTWSGQPS